MYTKILRPVVTVLVVCFLLSCSKDDGNSMKGEDVFLLPYAPLKSLDELYRGSYVYGGFKAEGREASMILENSKSCRAFDDLYVTKDSFDKVSLMEYNLHTAGQFGCVRDDIIRLEENKIYKEGILFTTIKDRYGKRIFKGLLEIGFQGDYLRLEDRMSDYKRKDPNEKVYLYFKIQ